MTRLGILAFCLVPLAFSEAQTDWPQWGGPNRNFVVNTASLANEWPAGGPQKLWSRALGEGHSAILAEGNTLYTMYKAPRSSGHVEIVIAMDAHSGKTLWEYRYDAPLFTRMDLQFGHGPHATPLLAGDRLFTYGMTGVFHCLDKKSGRVLWKANLPDQLGAQKLDRGLANSPIAWRDTVILPVGGKGHAVVALRQSDGAVVWRKHDFENSFSSPVLINVNGQEQLVVFMAGEVIALNPADGELLWKHPHHTDYGLNISVPVWSDGNLLFLSAAYNAGSRMLQLTRKEATTVKELWFTNRMRIHHGNAVRVGQWIIGSSGDFGPAPLVAAHILTGEEAWRDRSFAKANLIVADGKLIILDEDGRLALARVTPKGLQVLAKTDLLQKTAWTPPTLAGTRLYVRDRRQALAVDLK